MGELEPKERVDFRRNSPTLMETRTSVKGTLSEPGMWPERSPGRGSGASPLKRAAARASISFRLEAPGDGGRHARMAAWEAES